MSRYCSPVSPSHMDHLFHSWGIFSLGWHIFAHSHIFCGILCVFYGQHRQDYCDLSIGKSPVALWMLRRRRVKGAPAILASAFAWNLMKVILVSVFAWKFKIRMPSWPQLWNKSVRCCSKNITFIFVLSLVWPLNSSSQPFTMHCSCLKRMNLSQQTGVCVHTQGVFFKLVPP